jgi:hypothetical protein
MPSDTSRRGLLAAVGGVAGTFGLGYAGARVAADEGTVVAKHVIADRRRPDGLVESVDVLNVELNRDGSLDRRGHEDYADAFGDPPVAVSLDMDRRLRSAFDEVRYHLNVQCPDGSCTVPQVNRLDFNDSEVGSRTRIIDHGVSATVIP